MKKLIWKLYNENRISEDVALELLDKYYEQSNSKKYTYMRIKARKLVPRRRNLKWLAVVEGTGFSWYERYNKL